MDTHTTSLETANDLVSRLLGLARRHLGLEVAWMSSFDGQAVLVEVVEASDSSSIRLDVGDPSPMAPEDLARVLSGELPDVVADTSTEEHLRSLCSIRDLGIGAYVAVPVRDSRDEVLGMICCVHGSPVTHLDDESVRVLELIARLTGEVLADQSPSLLRNREVRRLITDTIAQRRFRTVFQPVVSLRTGRATGAEALTRFHNTDYEVQWWFSTAQSVGLGVDLEVATASGALESLPLLPSELYLAVNVSPSTLVDPRFSAAIEASEPRRIVLEVTEHDAIGDYAGVVTVLQRLRALGVRIAIDDVGAGFASFAHVLELSPNVLKLDKSITRGIDSDPARRALASAAVEVARRLGAQVVAEGVETRAELAAVASVGVSAVQGYLLHEPGPLPMGELDVPEVQPVAIFGLTPPGPGMDLELVAEQFELAMLHSPIGVCLVATDGTFRHVNPALAAMLGYSPSELLELTFQDLTHPDDLDLDMGYLLQCLDGSRNSYRIEKRYLRNDGDIVWADLSVIAVRDETASVSFFVSQILDVTERREREAALELQARTDHLTGLVNRTHLERILDDLVAADGHFGLLFCDVSGFKAVNDEHGHAAGDEVLRTVAARIVGTVRNSDTIARWGGDEFVVVIPGAGMPMLEEAARRISSVCGEPIPLGGRASVDGAHLEIGVAYRGPGDDSSAEELLHRADHDMYERRSRSATAMPGDPDR